MGLWQRIAPLWVNTNHSQAASAQVEDTHHDKLPPMVIVAFEEIGPSSDEAIRRAHDLAHKVGAKEVCAVHVITGCFAQTTDHYLTQWGQRYQHTPLVLLGAKPGHEGESIADYINTRQRPVHLLGEEVGT